MIDYAFRLEEQSSEDRINYIKENADRRKEE